MKIDIEDTHCDMGETMSYKTYLLDAAHSGRTLHIPVSYTHLDVYKRQFLSSTNSDPYFLKNIITGDQS